MKVLSFSLLRLRTIELARLGIPVFVIPVVKIFAHWSWRVIAF